MAFHPFKNHWHLFALGLSVFAGGFLIVTPYLFATIYQSAALAAVDLAVAPPPVLDIAAYNARMLALAHVNIASTTFSISVSTTLAAAPLDASATTTATSTPRLLEATTTDTTSVSIAGKRWPAAAAYPKVGALLPFNRIVAYYGNFYSTQMGVLGQYPPEEMLARLASTTASWAAADPSTPATPALDYIAVTAQAAPGADGTYRARMPDSQIDKALALASQVNGLVVLDIQVGKSDLAHELPLLEKYWALPNVELAIDPEFSMKHEVRPGLEIGTMDATDINYAAQYLAKIVQENNLPPKILVAHRFTEAMVTNYQNITPLPEVQIVMDMDGFGTQARKLSTYTYIVAAEPVQFTGFKLFYKNDIPPHGDVMMTPAQVLSLTPAPVFIQYQ